jgi:hypothetical protein
VDVAGIPAEGPRAFSTDSFKPRLTAAGRNHPVTSLSLDPKANEARWAARPPLQGINRVARLQPAATALLVHPGQVAGDGQASQFRMGFAVLPGCHSQGAQSFGSSPGAAARVFCRKQVQRNCNAARRAVVGVQGAHTCRHSLAAPILSAIKIDVQQGQRRVAHQPTNRAFPEALQRTPIVSRCSCRGLLAARASPASVVGRCKAPVPGTVSQQSECAAFAKVTDCQHRCRFAAGAYRLIGRATLDGRAVEEQATFVLRPEGRELDDVVSRDEVLRQIAAVTGGEFRVGTLGTPSIRPARQVRVGSLRTVAIWSHPSLLFLALALLAGSTSGDPGEGVMG